MASKEDKQVYICRCTERSFATYGIEGRLKATSILIILNNPWGVIASFCVIINEESRDFVGRVPPRRGPPRRRHRSGRAGTDPFYKNPVSRSRSTPTSAARTKKREIFAAYHEYS